MLTALNNRLSIGARLTLVSAIFVVPTVIALFLLGHLHLDSIDFTKSEQAGSQYLQRLWPTVEASVSHPSDARSVDDGLEGGAKAFAAGQAMTAFKAAPDATARLAAGASLIAAVADGSKLTLDPDLDSFYAQDAVTVRLPTLLVAADDLRAAAASGDAVKIQLALGRLKTARDAADGSLSSAMADNAAGLTKVALGPRQKAIDLAADAFTAQVSLAASGKPADTAGAYANLTAAIDQGWTASATELSRLLDARNANLQRSTIIELLICGFALALAVLGAIIVARGLRGQQATAEASIMELKATVAAMDRSQARVEFDLTGKVLDANDNFLQAMGYALDEIVGRQHAMFVDPEFARSSDYRDFWQSLNAGEGLSAKYQRVGKGGRVVWIQGSYIPLLGADGKPFKVVKFAADVTDLEVARQVAEIQRAERTQEQASVVSALAQGLGELSRGNLVAQITMAFPTDYETLRTDFNAALTSLAETLDQVRAGTDSIRTGTDEIASASDDLSRRTEHQAASLEETAAALDQITATVKKTASGSKQASETTACTKDAAVHSGEVVAGAVEAMGLIETSAQQISQIIGVIDEIAFQTNLLALNAGVEAAQAGDAGKGFAVVAQEVRALAQRSAEAAKEIKALISTSSRQVGQGVSLVAETGKALEQISVQVGEIDLLVSEIAASAQEQSSALAEVNTAANQMDQVVQQNAAMVEQSTAATHSLKAETAEVARLIARFQTGQGEGARRAPPRAPVARAQPVQAPTRKVSATVGAAALKGSDNGWEEF